MVTPEILNRKGARKVQDIPEEVLSLLSKGEIETVNLTEWLGINHIELVENTFRSLGLGECIEEIKSGISCLKKPTAMSSTKSVGSTIYSFYKDNKDFESIVKRLSDHTSDTIRCYATYLISLDEKLSIKQKLDQSVSLIADNHFGVREVVWMALRPEIEKELSKSIKILSTWTADPDENVRRFTTEATRPRGVWCKHIERLKENPDLALPILDKLNSDTSKYVQNSVGNWLNDASKTSPEFVLELCEKWTAESQTKETKNTVKRALRTIRKS